MPDAFIAVERQSNGDGQPRQAGFEIEFAGLDLAQVAEVTADCLSGEIVPGTSAECTVEVPEFGTFKIELDWQAGKELAKARSEQVEPDADDKLMETLTSLASEIVPVEVVCPPIRFDELSILTPLIERLRAEGAEGTRQSPVFAFGVHINPELPDLEPKTIASYLKAFCLSQEWLVRANEVDFSRRITPYIDLYPDDYVQQVLAYDSSVTQSRLIDDYLEFNPTRNRALDMTPLFRHLDEERLVAKLDDDRINARPTFHYRLPDCRISDSDWHLSDSWNYWCVIEHLSSRVELMSGMSTAWRARKDNLLSLKEPPWHEQLDEIHKNLS